MFLKMVPMVRAQSRHCVVKGLDLVICRKVSLMPPNNFSEVLEVARQAEVYEQDIAREGQ